MTPESFRSWLEAYKAAWERRDPDAAVALFSDMAVYHEAPFREPMRGRDVIRAYWEHIPRTQEQVNFQFEVLAVAGDAGIARWWASFVRIPAGKRVHLDGMAVAHFDGEGKCVLFREWWHKREA